MHSLDKIIQDNRREIQKHRARLNESLKTAGWTNDDGLHFEPFIEGHTIGYRVTDPDTGRVEHVMLVPSSASLSTLGIGDTYLYFADSDASEEHETVKAESSIVDFAQPIDFVAHFAE